MFGIEWRSNGGGGEYLQDFHSSSEGHDGLYVSRHSETKLSESAMCYVGPKACTLDKCLQGCARLGDMALWLLLADS